MQTFIGVEGGASFSKAVLITETGTVLASVEDAPSTNYLLVGVQLCEQRLNEIVQRLKANASIDAHHVPEAIGLCLSGCEDEENNKQFSRNLLQKFPSLATKCIVGSDTFGSIMTASPNGGIVLIAGTGSNSFLLNPNGTTKRCGGWGHLFGDNGSGFWIVNKAITAVLNADDSFDSLPYDIERVRDLIYKHFKIDTTFGLLEPAYLNFSKTEFAALCVKLAEAANDGDKLSRFVFHEAGKELGKHVVALLPFVECTLLDSNDGLKIVCVGSVFKSWNLLKDGFFTALGAKVKKLTLVQLTKSAAIGAAFYAAKQTNYDIPLDFTQNANVLCRFSCE
ncbi:N-acetyl-D-glucosamine kinase-like protein [Dinothrombium tinctorium]|uniref:N-acetyl-D-glucosamine kinase n=1 Tax=Dinothrombium tinctorium TaxID=1965070 RepID=A0A443QUY2_9ACAR|nr:N-acetyl-D-glucosamine kinase-like protein [Dinothrombium tinctorium]